MMRPLDPVTYSEAAHILGVTKSTVRRLVIAGRLPHVEPVRHRMLSRPDVETLALRTYKHWRHKHDRDSYWVTGRREADLLGVNVSRLNQLALRGFLPFEVHADGTRYRREELLTVANAKQVRCGDPLSGC